jgi:GDP-D-mannose dehydratase
VRKVENDGLIADTTKARAELQWWPEFQFREIVLEMLKSRCKREGIDIPL